MTSAAKASDRVKAKSMKAVGSGGAGRGPGEVYHGGNLAAARERFPDAPQPWLDLSTGINPIAYRVADSATVVAAPGEQALIQLLPVLSPVLLPLLLRRLVSARRVGILGFT